MPDDSTDSQQSNTLLILSIVILIIGIIGIPKIWVSEDDLKSLTGQLDSARSTVSWEFRQKRRYPNEVDKHHSSKLFFRLKGKQQDFVLAHNIGDHYINEQFESILKALKSADSITVWTKSKNDETLDPKVYRIDCNSTPVLEFHPLHLENSVATPILLVAGIFLTSLALIARKRNSRG